MSTDPSETRNYQRFIAAFIDIGTETLLKLLYYKKPKHELKNFILSKDTDLKRDLSEWQYKKLKYILANNTDDFDISLLLALLSSQFEFEGVMKEDLKKMRKIRNKIVAHSTKATMNEKDYDSLFEKLDTIIWRIVKVVDTAFVDSVATKIKMYKEMSPESSRVAEYKATLKEWHDELGKELLKYNHDLKMFFSHENEKYIRYIKLLTDAAPKVLKGFLLHELKCRRQTVKEFLMQNQTFLMANLRNQDTVSQLFGTEEDGTTIAYPDITWDACVIAEVLLIVFRGNITRRERKHIQGLKRAHETYSTTAIEALDKDKIEHCWAELSHSLRSLAEDLGEDIEEEVNNLIKKYLTYNCSDLELGDLLEKLKSRCRGIASIADKYQETVQKLHTALEGLTTDEAVEFRKYEIDVKIHVCCDNCHKTLQVEQAIIGLFTNPDEDDEPAIPALREIKRAINSIKGISVVGAVTESVVLTVRCESGQSLLQLINYINWKGFQDHLTNLEAELEDQFDDIFHVSGNLTLDTLTRWFDPHSGQLKKQFEGGVVLSLASTSQEGSNLKRHRDEDLNIELQPEGKLVQKLRQEIDKLQRENRDLRIIQTQNGEVIDEIKKEKALLEGYLNGMEQFDQITQIELEDSQAENKNLLNQIDEITKHAEAEKFELKIQLEESVKERELLERLENVRMEELRELKIQKSDLEKRLLVMSYEEISKQKTDQLFQLKITQIELEEVQAENKNLLNQMAQITKHAEAEKFELKIQLEESAKERQLLERLENVRMEELRELKIQKSELEKRLLVMSYEEISKQKFADLELENAAIRDSHKDFIWRSKQESSALREELYRIERQQIVDREQCENDIRRINNTKHGHAVYRLHTHHTKIADLKDENDAIRDSCKDFIWRSKQENRALREELYRIERKQIVDREQFENDIRRINHTKHGQTVYALHTHHTKIADFRDENAAIGDSLEGYIGRNKHYLEKTSALW